jgi:hypothetical protein
LQRIVKFFIGRFHLYYWWWRRESPLNAKGRSGLGGGLGSVLELDFNNLALFHTPSEKIYNTHQIIVSNLQTCSEYEVLHVIEGESLPSSLPSVGRPPISHGT